MRRLVVFIMIFHLFACAAKRPSDVSQPGHGNAKETAQRPEPAAPDTSKPIKSPHGYIITKDYEPGRFGGFIGDCADDLNWPYYWQCMSENSGNGGFN